MSWDIVLFNSKEKIVSVSELDATKLEPINFCEKIESHFEKIIEDENHRTIKGENFEIDYFSDNELVSNKMLSIYGENGLFRLIELAKNEDWQIYDTNLEDMIDLENPKKNGYKNFRNYLEKIMKNKNDI